MTEHVRQHPRGYSDVDLPRRVRVAKHVAAKIRRPNTGNLRVINKNVPNCSHRIEAQREP